MVTKTVTTVSATVVRQRLSREESTPAPEPSSSVLPSSETLQETPQVTIQLVKVTPPAAAPMTVVEPAAAVQSQGTGQGEQKEPDGEAENTSEDDVPPTASDGAFYDDGHQGDSGSLKEAGQAQDGGTTEEGADGIRTVTVEETHTSTHLVYETRTMTP